MTLGILLARLEEIVRTAPASAYGLVCADGRNVGTLSQARGHHDHLVLTEADTDIPVTTTDLLASAREWLAAPEVDGFVWTADTPVWIRVRGVERALIALEVGMSSSVRAVTVDISEYA